MRLTLWFGALICLGFVVAVSAAGGREFSVALSKRLALTGLGVWAFAVGATVDYRWWRRHQLAIIAGALACLALVLVPGVGVAKNGARRWINPGLPLGFQPSEFAKVALCIWVAAYCERNLPRMRTFTHGFLLPLGVVGLACVLILLEPDFGTAVLAGLVCVIVLLVLGTRLLFVLLATAASLPLLHQLVLGVPYRLRRIVAFLDPFGDPQGAGYQLVQSLIAIGSGGVTGRGLGAGLQKEAYLPGAANDFVFSVLSEELGFIGAVAVIVLFVALLWELLRVVQGSRDPFGFGLSLGLTVLLGVQVVAHIAVTTGCVPTKGLSLPFISAGGSSLIASMFAAGVLVNVARSQEDHHRHERKPWYEDIPLYERLAGRVVRPLGELCRRKLEPHLE
ncbi:MAG: putative peptidoglycan glycosyltransferase FtsW [Candidatus Brocadiaceae bacterium]